MKLPLASRRVACALLLSSSSALLSAQSPWVKQAPLPTWKNCLSIDAVGDDEYFASAGALFGQSGDVLHCRDGFLDWEVAPVNVSTLNAVHFLDPLTGWAAGNGVFGTTDGGATWTQLQSLGSIYDLYAVDEDHVWAAGNGGIVYRTTDGWATWTAVFAGLGGTTATDVFFLDQDHGWAAGIGGYLSETTDGGVTWTTRYTGGYMTAVRFFDDLEGWGLGGNTFVHTVDGGLTWNAVATPAGTWVHSGTFYDRQRGIAVGDGGNIVYTHDGGQSWQTARGPASGPRLWEVDFSDGGVAVVSGENGVLLRSDDFGVTWTQIQSGASWTVQGFDALDASTAWAAHQAGEIALTTNGGALWERVQVTGFDAFGNLFAIGFADAENGWAAGQQDVFGMSFDDGRIARSTDGGRTWTLQFSQNGLEFFGLEVLDANTAIAYGRGALATSAYLRTDDGGQTWTGAGNPDLGGTFRDSYFLDDALTGWLVSDDVWHTTDGGLTWTLQYDGGISLAGVSFADAQHGWVSGFVNELLYTDDGGQTWTPQDAGGPAGAAYTSVEAISALEAVVVGWDGFVARTTDGGQTWVQESVPDLTIDEGLVEFNAVLTIDGVTWIGGNDGIWVDAADGVPAGVTARNGSGVNPAVFASTTDPVLGTAWVTSVDAASAGAGGGLTFVVGYERPLDGVPTALGELLVDVTGPALFGTVATVSGGTSTHSNAVPLDPTLSGFTLSTQAYVGGAGVLTNALDLVLGDF